MWECPDFFQLGKKHVLLYSTAGRVIWETGELDPKELVFHPEKRGVLDHGAYYAQKTQLDAKGNRILWGWIPEKRPDSELIAAGWAGCMALPRVLTLGSNDELSMQVAPQAYMLRATAFIQSEQDAQAAAVIPSPQEIGIDGLCGEIYWTTTRTRCTFTLEDKSGSWLSIELVPKGSHAVVINVNGKAVEVGWGDMHLFEFHLYVDGSVAELLCDRKHAFTMRVYRQTNGPLRFRSSEDLKTSFYALQAWQLQPISANRLTT